MNRRREHMGCVGNQRELVCHRPRTAKRATIRAIVGNSRNCKEGAQTEAERYLNK